MLPLRPYDINKLRRIARHGNMMWELFIERDEKLEEMYTQVTSSPIFKMEMTQRLGVRKQEVLEQAARQALIFGDECLGPFLNAMLFDYNPDLHVTALASYFFDQELLSDDDYLKGFDFRLSILCNVIRIIIGDVWNHTRDEAVLAILKVIPLTYAQHVGVINFFQERINDRPRIKAS